MKSDLECLKFEDVLAEGEIIVKKTLWEGSNQWVTLPLKELRRYCQTLDPNKVRAGEIALYIQLYILYYQTRLYLPHLDVEHKDEHHQSIQANIDAARALYYVFHELGMVEDLVIGLSGNGLRFIWPWVIPYGYTEAFLEMVKDNNRFPGIDPSPQIGTNKFMRTLAYRGHSNQGKQTSQQHIHYLDRAEELLSLDPAQYKRLVHGRPDVGRCIRDIDRIMPKGMAPPEATQVLEEYVFKIKVGSTIAFPGTPRIGGPRGINLDLILAYLDEKDITYEKFEHKAIEILKLDSCPCCGEKEGNPFITPSGRLKCFRSNKCEAGQSEKGLTPYEWVPNYAPAENDEQDVEVPGMDLPEARALLPQGFETEGDVMINASPGVGKTHAVVEYAVTQAKDKLILYTAPTHTLGREVFNKVQSLNAGIETRYIEGRNDDNCVDLGAVKTAAAKGYFPSRTVCLTCENRRSCLYNAQFKDLPATGIIFSAHITVKYLTSRLTPQIWIIDESPLMEFFEQMEVPQEEMDAFMLTEPGDIHSLFTEIKKVALDIASRIKDNQIGKLFVDDVPPGHWENAPVLNEINPEITQYFELNLYPCNSSRVYSDIKNPVVWENIQYKNDMNMKCIKWWDYVIERDPNISMFIEISKAGGKPQIVYKAVKLDPPVFPDCRAIHLDGTMYPPEIPEIFSEDMTIIDAQVHLNTCRKVHIMISRGKHKVKKLGHPKMKGDLAMLIGHLRPDDREVLIITYKDFESIALDIVHELRPDLTFGVIHFWGPRGINAYENFDACLVYGTPTVNPAGVEDLAAALFAEQEEMDRWKASLGHRDLTQAIHRIRPVNGGKNIVVMGSYWPTEYLGHTNERIDLMRKGSNMEQARQRLTAFANEYGFIDKPVANLLGVGTKYDKSAINAWQTRLSAAQGGILDRLPTLIKIIYKSGEAVTGTPPAAIYLHKNGQWNHLLDQVQAETGLPTLGTYKPPGKGGRSRVLGTVENLVEFYESTGSALDLSLYDIDG